MPRRHGAPQVPRQPNFYDCGVYVVEAAVRFLMLVGVCFEGMMPGMVERGAKVDAYGEPLFTRTWFKKEAVTARRKTLKGLVLALHETGAHILALHFQGAAVIDYATDDAPYATQNRNLRSNVFYLQRQSNPGLSPPTAPRRSGSRGSRARVRERQKVRTSDWSTGVERRCCRQDKSRRNIRDVRTQRVRQTHTYVC